MFRAWFVDFEPVKAKAGGATGFPSMPQEVFDGLPTRLVDSEMGLVPVGWRIGSILLPAARPMNRFSSCGL
jgi:type I restriction enzyme S subunit